MHREQIEAILLKVIPVYESIVKGKGLTFYDILILIAIKDTCRHELSADNALLLRYGIYNELKDVFAKLVKSGFIERVHVGEYILTSKGSTIVSSYIKELSRYIN